MLKSMTQSHKTTLLQLEGKLKIYMMYNLQLFYNKMSLIGFVEAIHPQLLQVHQMF